MPTIAEVREKYPQYSDMPDEQLAQALHKKYYADMPYEDFAGKIGIQASPKAADKPDSFLGNVAQGAGDLLAGAVRGAGSIGSTILAPYDMAKDAIAGKGLSLESNRARRDAIDGGLREMGANPDSAMYQVGKIGGEIAGTAGAGGVLANGVRVVTTAPRAAAFANALQTGGMRAGATPGAANMLTRVAGGATAGAATAGMVDPESAGTGALIGGALPPALKVAGKVGGAAKRVISGPAVAEPLRQAVESARGAGYVIPPSQAKPTLVNRALEGFSGKITTAQNASAKNQPITQRLIAQELGLPAGTPVSLDALKAVRLQAGNAYEAVGSAGTIKTTPAYIAALDKITASAKQAAAGFPNAKPNPIIAEIESLKTPQFDASSAVAKIKELRAAADAAYAGGNKDLGKALKAGSAALEDAIEAHLTATGAPKTLLDGFRNARQLIAKTYSVEKAMNATTGNVDAVKLGQQLAKGKPLSGGIRDAAAFGQQFPKAAQSIEKMGSLPQVSPLDFGALGTMSALTANPLLMAGVLARPAARGAVLSNVVQNSLAKPQGQNALGNLLKNPNSQQLLYRGAPVVSAQ